MVEIKNSYCVNSRYDRQKICAIISNTNNITSRTSGNMSAEWFGHNVAKPIPFLESMAESVGIDYYGDYRSLIKYGTKALEILRWV